MAELQATLFVYLAVGFLIRRLKLVTDETRSGITNLLLNVLVPCLVFESFSPDTTAAQIISAGELLLVSFCTFLFSYLLGKFIYLKYAPAERKILQYGTLIANSVFAGFPLIRGAYGQLGFFYASIFVIPLRIFMWTLGISMFTETDRKTRLKNAFLNPGIIAVALGIVRMLLRIPLPSFLDTAIMSIGECTSSLSLIIVGMVLADIKMRSVFKAECFYASFIRLIFLPVLLLIVLKAIGYDSIQTATAVTLTGMPFASTTALLAQKYGANAELASKCVFVSTALSLITIPLITIFV